MNDASLGTQRCAQPFMNPQTPYFIYRKAFRDIFRIDQTNYREWNDMDQHGFLFLEDGWTTRRGILA
jgi:hypothetical protein